MDTFQYKKLTALLNKCNGANIQWDKPTPSWEKAYVSSLMAEAAYLHIPLFEVSTSNRLNIVPCRAYWEIINSCWYGNQIKGYTFYDEGGEGGEGGVEGIRVSVVAGELIMALIVITEHVIFIALRGTEITYRNHFIQDWQTNLQTKQIRYCYNDAACFHKGFYEAVASIYDEILTIVSREKTRPIYITGHSLGGAMAAILNARWHQEYEIHQFIHTKLRLFDKLPTSCYVFGMPRYGNIGAVHNLKFPYHIYRELDGIPTVPSTERYYADINDETLEKCLSNMNSLPLPQHQNGNFEIFNQPISYFFDSHSPHSMWRYISDLQTLS